MCNLGSQKPIGAASFRVVPQSLGAECHARLLKGPFEQPGMELADDVSGYRTGFTEDAVPGQDLLVMGHDVVRTQGS